MKELYDMRITLVSEKKDLTIKNVEINYTYLDSVAGIGVDKLIVVPIEEFDLSGSVADMWNFCLGKIQ